MVLAGFDMPSYRGLEEALARGLDALRTESGPGCKGEAQICSFAHLINVVWGPILQHMDSLDQKPAPKWSSKLACNHEALVAEMKGHVLDPDETLDIDAWVEYIKETLHRLLKVHVSQRLILTVMSSVVPWHVAPTPANALHLLRSSWCIKLVGPALAAQANRMILSEIADVPVPLLSDQDLAQAVRQDLVEALEQRFCPETEDEKEPGPALKKSRTSSARSDMMEQKTQHVLFMLKNRVSATRVQDTIEDACELLSSRVAQDALEDLREKIVSRWNLVRHMLLLDGALDRAASEKFMATREEGLFAGVALATDESPPSQARFRGLRFQISVIYTGTFVPMSRWSSCSDPPILRRTCLADICHCPGKKGADVSRVIEKQLGRLGLNCFDVVSGTGDGGGENEGHNGVHAHFEGLNPGYVRRRCLPHIAWRTCDVAIKTSGLQYKPLAAYMVEGITWQRLRELATRQVPDGGLGLFREGSQQCKDLFGKSPSAICESRPDTDLRFLKVLEGHEHELHRLASKDLEQRKLSQETQLAVQHLGDIKARIRRRILQELLERCLFLLHWNSRHNMVADGTQWDELLEKAVKLILDLKIDPEVLKRLQVTEERLAAMPARPTTWVRLVVLQVLGDPDLVEEHMEQSLDFHRQVSDSAAAHLNLLLLNTFRAPWMTAKLLANDKFQARDAASALLQHLATTRLANRTFFEEHLFNQEDLRRPLEDFARAEPPELLWHANGKYESLFKFLAPRFLLAPDHVLDCERVHARWQWLCGGKRSLKLQTLNASLRIMHLLEHQQALPNHEELLPHLDAERMEHNLSMEALEEEGDVALGWRSSWSFRTRFNLSIEGRELLEGAVPAGPVVPGAAGPFATAWRNYIKAMFVKGQMYKISFKPSVILYIAENKTLAGKEERSYEGEALGRKLAVVFFEALEGDLAQRVDKDTGGMRQVLLSIAEILQALGVELPADPARTAADTELLLESHYLHLDVARFKCTIEPEAPEAHVYRLEDEKPAEVGLVLETKEENRTKMMLARSLERFHELQEGETLQSTWSLTLAALRARSAHLFPAPPAPPAPAAPPAPPAAGEGRGRGRGRGAAGRGRRARGR